MIKFKTYSGTEYILTEVKEEGSFFTAWMERIGEGSKGIFDIRTNTTEDVEPAKVIFTKMPAMDERFEYVHPVMQRCWSSVITELTQKEE